jgi:hypothetical protein
VTDHPGEQFPPAVDPDVEPGYDGEPEEQSRPDYDAEPAPESRSTWVNPTLQGRPHTDPLLAGFTVYGDPTPEPEPEPAEDTEQAFEASLEEPTQHSFVDDGLDDSYTEPEPEPEHHAPPTPPAAESSPPRPDQAFPRPAATSSGQGLSGPDALSASRPPVPAQGGAGPASPVPGHGGARPASPVPGGAGPASPVPGGAGPASPVPGQGGGRPVAPMPGPAFARPSAPAPVVPGDTARQQRADGEVHPLVEEVMARLEGLGERPVGEHAEVFADLHERLQSALVEADAEHGDRG